MNTIHVALHCSAGGPAQWDWYKDWSGARAGWHTPHLVGYADASPWRRGLPLALEDEAWRLLPILRRSAQPVHLVGHSYGGAVALRAAASWPERVASVTVYEPVLFHLLHEDPWSTQQAREVINFAGDVAGLVRDGMSDAAARRFVEYWTPGAWERAPLARQAQIAACMAKVSAEFSALFQAKIALGELEAVPQVRVVSGTMSPAPVRRIVDILRWQMPFAEFVEVAGADHMTPVTQPQRVVQAMFAHSEEGWALAA